MKHTCPHCKTDFECGNANCEATHMIPDTKRCWKRIRSRYARQDATATMNAPTPTINPLDMEVTK